VESKYFKQTAPMQWIKQDSTKPVRMIPQRSYDVRVNGRWICGGHPDQRETDSFPVMLVDNDTGDVYFCTKIIFHQGSYTHVESMWTANSSGKNTVRMRTTGDVTVY